MGWINYKKLMICLALSAFVIILPANASAAWYALVHEGIPIEELYEKEILVCTGSEENIYYVCPAKLAENEYSVAFFPKGESEYSSALSVIYEDSDRKVISSLQRVKYCLVNEYQLIYNRDGSMRGYRYRSFIINFNGKILPEMNFFVDIYKEERPGGIHLEFINKDTGDVVRTLDVARDNNGKIHEEREIFYSGGKPIRETVYTYNGFGKIHKIESESYQINKK